MKKEYMPRKKKKVTNKIPNLTNTILKILKKDPKKTYNYKQIAAKLGVNDPSSRNQIIKKLRQLQVKDKIKEVKVENYPLMTIPTLFAAILTVIIFFYIEPIKNLTNLITSS